MHFTGFEIDDKKFKKIKEALGPDETKICDETPIIIDKDAKIWVSKSNAAFFRYAFEDAIVKEVQLTEKNTDIVKFSKGVTNTIPILLNLCIEIVYLLGFKRIRVCDNAGFEKLNYEELSDPETLIFIIGALPRALHNGWRTDVKQYKFGSISTRPVRGIRLCRYAYTTPDEWLDRIVNDDLGNSVGAFCGNKIWCGVELQKSKGEFNTGWYPTLIAREVLSRCLAKMASLSDEPEDPTKREELLEAGRADFIKNCRSDVDRQKQLLTSEIDRLNTRQAVLEKEYAQNIQKIREKSRLLALLDRPDAKNDKLNKDYDNIIKFIPKLRSMKFITNGIKFETEVLTMSGDTRTTGKKMEYDPFPLGRYRVELLRGSVPHVTNITRRLKYKFDRRDYMWDHPHVQDHRICLGGAGPTVSKLVDQDNWFAAIQYVIEALESFNSQDGWSPPGLKAWSEAAREENLAFKVDDAMKDRIRGWVSYRPRMPIGLKAEIGDEVVAKCPDTCIFKDTGKCPIQKTGERKARIEGFFEDNLLIRWEDEDKKSVGCSSFNYQSVTFLDGEPIVREYREPKNNEDLQQVGRKRDKTEPDPILEVKTTTDKTPKIGGFEFRTDLDRGVVVGKDPKGNTIEIDLDAFEREKANLARLVDDVTRAQHDDVTTRTERMIQEEDNMIPPVHLDTEETPGYTPDAAWFAEYGEILPEDDDLVDTFEAEIEEEEPYF